MEDGMDRLANLLSAAATAISDAQIMAMARHAELKPSTAAAILTLGQHDLLTLSQLAQIVGISHSGTVRLVDGLVHKGLVMRGDGRDRREVAVSLTAQGRELYARLRLDQDAVLMPLIADLPPEARRALEAALAHLLAGLTRGRQSADHICRFCDESACVPEDCPVERRALALDPPA
jgi:DNA-binding MarR family transcriptional regulator